jgi:hypothetical protein
VQADNGRDVHGDRRRTTDGGMFRQRHGLGSTREDEDNGAAFTHQLQRLVGRIEEKNPRDLPKLLAPSEPPRPTGRVDDLARTRALVGVAVRRHHPKVPVRRVGHGEERCAPPPPRLSQRPRAAHNRAHRRGVTTEIHRKTLGPERRHASTCRHAIQAAPSSGPSGPRTDGSMRRVVVKEILAHSATA